MCEKRPNEPWLAYMCRYVVEQPRAVLAVIGIAAAIVLYCDLRSFIAEQAEAQEKTIRRAVRDVCPIADHRAPDGGVPHAAAPGDEAISTSGMTAKEDKKTPARVGRVPGLILGQLWGRPSLAGGVLCV